MTYTTKKLTSRYIPFVGAVYTENMEILHGSPISLQEWEECLAANADPSEVNFVIFADKEPAAWLKINGLDEEELYISMLVVSKRYQRMGVGRYALQFSEEYAIERKKSAVKILTTKDNTAAISLYLAQGYEIESSIRYTTGNGALHAGYRFCKKINHVN